MKSLLLTYFTILTFAVSGVAQCDTASVLADPCATTSCGIVLFGFETDDTIGCIPFEVAIINTSSACIPRYTFGDGSERTNQSTHTYTTAGLFDVKQFIGSSKIDSLTKPKLIRAVSNNAPDFTINYCKDLKIVLTFSEDNLYDKYVIDYGDGSNLDTVAATASPEKTYLDAISKQLTVTGIYDNAPCSGSSSQTVFPQAELLLPDIKEVEITNYDPSSGILSINLEGNPFFDFTTHLATNNTTSFNEKDSFKISGNDTTINLSNLNTTDNSYCLYLAVSDFCGNELLSDTICSLHLNTLASNNQNSITWNSYLKNAQISNYSFVKNESETTIPSTQLDSTDQAIVCGTEYCYQIQTSTNTTTATLVKSNTLCVTGISTDTPESINSLLASVIQNNTIELSWKSPLPFSVQETDILFFEKEPPYSPLGTTIDFDSSFTHNTIINDQYCYIINYTDACNNPSDRALPDTSCTIYLEATQNQDTEYDLQWTPYMGFDTTSYFIQYLDDNRQVLFEKPVGSTTSFTDQEPIEEVQTLTYRIKAVSSSDEESTSNTVSFEFKSRIFIPNAFSPDGDQINDFFKPSTRFIESFDLSIYNKWGELIYYEQEGTTGWDGYYKGKKVQPGTYVYLLEGIDMSGKKIEKKGTVTVYE